MLLITTNSRSQTATIPEKHGSLRNTALPEKLRGRLAEKHLPMDGSLAAKSEERVVHNTGCELCGHEKVSKHLCQSCVEMIARLKGCAERTPELQRALVEYRYAQQEQVAAALGK